MSVKQHIVDLSKAIEKEITFNKEEVTIQDNDTFGKNLPEGMSMDTVNAVNQYETDYVAASTMAFGNLAVEVMKGNKKIDSITGTFNMADKNHIEHTIHRTKEYRNPQKPDESIIKHGDISSTYYVHAGKNQGQLKQAREAIKDIAAEALGVKK